MRTTVDLGDELFRRAKERAAAEGIPFREVLEAALRSYLSTRRGRRDYKLRWPADRGRPRPGVKLDDRDALFDLMDGIG
jgi:hypothetical protein